MDNFYTEESMASLVGKYEREKMRLATYKVGTKDYNKSYMLVRRYEEDIVKRAVVLFSPYSNKKALARDTLNSKFGAKAESEKVDNSKEDK